MRHQSIIGLVLGVLIALTGQSLIGRSDQAPAAPRPAGGPFDTLHFRSVGPASMSGRISDLAVYEANPAVFYVGTAHGGVWKTTNNGTTFEAQFQDQGLLSIGDVTVSQFNPDIIWVGTGESNNRQSTSWGDGVYKSTDGGKTYVHMGLKTSRHINRILIDPRNNDVVFVAATGNLWGPGGERGVFKTVDGGKTWKQVLKVDDDTGANDLVMDSTNNQILYASTYQRRRTACCMNGGGPGSGIWKSTDGGETWTRLTGNGLPDGPLGRIALDAYRRRPTILYALIEGPVQPGAGRGGPGGGGGGRGVAQGVDATPTGLYRSDDAGATWRKVNNVNPRPMYFSQVRIDPNDPEIVFLGGVDLHLSLDGGKTVNTAAASKIHSDHHAIWINPANSHHVLIGNDGGLAVSYDQSKTWVFLPNLPVGLFYHVGYDMATPYNVCGGMQDNYDWCGPSAVRGSAGIAGYHWATIQGGDGFVVLQDPTDYRVAYTESQDGNMVRVDRRTFETISIRPQPGPGEPPLRWHWDTPLVMSPHDPKVIYAAANKVFRSSDRGLSWVAISSDLTESPPRDEIVTMGVKNSETQIARNDGIQAWPTIVTFAESPKRAGLLYAGTDDGNLAVSRDGGKKWANVINKLSGVPKGIYVSEVVPSRFDEGTVYATFDGHRQGDFETYIYVSGDFGETWRSIASNLEGEIARTLTEDVKNPDVLYLGTETGLFVSIDRGRSWMRIKANLPTVRIDEITLHPRDNAMLLATHGRAIWILDHLEPIQESAAAQSATADARLFTLPPHAMYRRPARDRNYEFWGDQTFFGENPPQAAVISWLQKRQGGELKLRITDATGREVREISGDVLAKRNAPGIQSACWDLRMQPVPAVETGQTGRGRGGEQAGREGGPAAPAPAESPFGAGCGAPAGGGGGGFFGGGATTAGPFALPGTYNIALVIDGKTVDTKPLRVTADPEVLLTELERRKMYDMAMEMHDLQRRATELANTVTGLDRQVAQIATTLGGRNDVAADVKSSFEAFQKDLTGLVQRIVPAAGGRGGGGGGRGGADPSLLGRIGQAKNGFMSGIAVTEQTTRAYNDAKTESPKVVLDVNAILTKAAAVSSSLAKYNITLTVPAAPKTSTTSSMR
ncbi:MAG: glycosyl hydrolase [Acidobacteria bacterium]|nr:glycosyl hydrolase [Acidobacteriota bacterium]